jgi:hypothetical protein
MGILPFVNQDGQRIVRWHRLVLVWIAVILACILGNGAMSYALMGDFWHDSFFAIWLGVFMAACITVRGFNLPIDKLPTLHPSSLSGGRNG